MASWVCHGLSLHAVPRCTPKKGVRPGKGVRTGDTEGILVDFFFLLLVTRIPFIYDWISHNLPCLICWWLSPPLTCCLLSPRILLFNHSQSTSLDVQFCIVRCLDPPVAWSAANFCRPQVVWLPAFATISDPPTSPSRCRRLSDVASPVVLLLQCCYAVAAGVVIGDGVGGGACCEVVIDG